MKHPTFALRCKLLSPPIPVAIDRDMINADSVLTFKKGVTFNQAKALRDLIEELCE